MREHLPMSAFNASKGRTDGSPVSTPLAGVEGGHGEVLAHDDLTAMTQMQRLKHELNSVCGAPMTAAAAFNGIDAV